MIYSQIGGYENIILFDGKTSYEWDEAGYQVDYVGDNGKQLFLSYMHDGYLKEYYTSSDSTYKYRSYANKHIYEEGQYIVEKVPTGKFDTVVYSCEDKIVIRRSYNLLKHGRWVRKTRGNEIQSGRYEYGCKQGSWREVDWRGNKRFPHYNEDVIMAVGNPIENDIAQFWPQIIDSVFVSGLLDKDGLMGKFAYAQIELVKKLGYQTDRYVEWVFREDGIFEMELFATGQDEVLDKRKGKWALDGCTLLLQLKGLEKKVTIDYIGKHKLRLISHSIN